MARNSPICQRCISSRFIRSKFSHSPVLAEAGRRHLHIDAQLNVRKCTFIDEDHTLLNRYHADLALLRTSVLCIRDGQRLEIYHRFVFQCFWFPTYVHQLTVCVQIHNTVADRAARPRNNIPVAEAFRYLCGLLFPFYTPVNSREVLLLLLYL